jgi:hypothetical protein
MTEFPKFAPNNLENSCLLKFGDISGKLQLRCSCQFSWRAFALSLPFLNNLGSIPDIAQHL